MYDYATCAMAQAIDRILKGDDTMLHPTTMYPMRSVPRDGSYVLLFIKSGYTTTPHRCEVARYDAVYRPRQPWVNYANDSVYDAGGDDADLVGWLPVPQPFPSPADRARADAARMDTKTELGEAKVAPERIIV